MYIIYIYTYIYIYISLLTWVYMYRKITYKYNRCSYDIASSYFTVQVKSGACYITGQWGRGQNKIK